MVSRFALLKELSALVPDDVLVLTSIGNNSGFWGQLKEREANLFHLTMGMCSSTALGLSLALPRRKIVALDSDGNLTLNLGVLGTIANEAPKNLTIVVMDNGNYLGSHKHAPGMPTATSGKMDLEAVARGCGIASASTTALSGTPPAAHPSSAPSPPPSPSSPSPSSPSPSSPSAPPSPSPSSSEPPPRCQPSSRRRSTT